MGTMESTTSCTRDDTHVTVTLTARSPAPQFVVPQRQITLTEQKPSVSIGRASKVPSKGFVAARENAWFESPVMSRQHAELIVNFDTNTLFIKDIGSLHGTFHKSIDNLEKEDRLCADEPVKLADGDRVRFGTDIYRSHDTFPPCTVDVHVKWSQPITKSASKTPSTNTYAVPDEDFLSSDDEDYSVMETEKPLPPQMVAHQLIDLTRGDNISTNRIPLAGTGPINISSSVTVGNKHSNIIDLTSEPDMDVSSDRGNGNTYGDISEGELSEDDHSECAEDSSSSSSPYEHDTPHIIRGYTRSPSAVGSGSHLDSDSDVDSAAENSEIDLSNEDDRSILMNGDSAQIPFSDDDVDADAKPDDELVSDDDNMDADADADADIDLDADGESVVDVHIVDEYATTDDFEEGRGTNIPISYFEDDMSSVSNSEDEDADTSMLDKHPAAAVDSPATSPPTVPLAKMADFNLPVPSSDSVTTGDIAKVWGVPTYQGFAASRDRQPSPSDAAMVKNHPLFGHPLFSSTAKSTAQVLGERTGNFDFWAARDHNRTIAMNMPLVSAVRETLAAEQLPNNFAKGVNDAVSSSASFVQFVEEKGASKPVPTSWNEPTPAKTVFPPPSNLEEDLVQHQSANSPLLAKSAWTASGEAFLNQPPQYSPRWLEERTRLQSPEPDMTSASTFKESKEESQNKANQTVRRLPIEDLLAQESKEATPTVNEVKDTPAVKQVTPVRPSKRPFESAFNATEEATSVENHATPTPRRAILQRYTRPDGSHGFRPARFDGPVDVCTLLADEPKAAKGEEASAVSTPAQQVLSTMPATPIQYHDLRPVKKRRFAQVAACALGTVLGGAAVLAGMIATAPSI